jgi:hypothetical protein
LSARLITDLWLGALRRRLSSAGLMVTVLVKGDITAGSVTLAERRRDGTITLYQATTLPDESRGWLRTSPPAGLTDAELSALGQRLRQRDPDAWLVEVETEDLPAILCEPILR